MRTPSFPSIVPSNRKHPISIVVSFVVALLVTGLLLAGPAPAAEQAPVGCGYGQGGPHDTTLCWLDMSGVNMTQARSAAGQPMTISLPGGNRIDFTLRISDGANGFRTISTAAFPTWSGTPVGNDIYRNTPGRPVLYQDNGQSGSGEKGIVRLSNIVARGPSGAAFTGYAFVLADAETTSEDEGLTFTSDKPVEIFDRAVPPGYTQPCPGGLTGAGTTSVRCLGSLSGARPGNLLTSTAAPTSVAIRYQNSFGGRQGIAFGVLTAKVALSKSISSPQHPEDGFEIAIEDQEDNIMRSANTNGGPSATIDPVTVLTDSSAMPFTFGETANPGTSLAVYRQSWSCTRNGVRDAEASSATGPRQDLVLGLGDDLRCTIVNTGPRPSMSLVKRAQLDDANGNDVADVGETITYSFEVANTGNRDLTDVRIEDDRVSGISCPRTTLAVGERMTCTADVYTVTQADVDAGEVVNEATAHGTPPDGLDPIASPPSRTNTPTPSPNPAIAVVKQAQLNDGNGNDAADAGETIDFTFTVTNTGNRTLTGITVDDDLVTGISCPADPLPPGESMTCTADRYTVTQADVDAGQVVNEATAKGTPPGGGEPVVSDPSRTNTPTPNPEPGIAIVKHAQLNDGNGNDAADAGETIDYSFTVTNTGNRTLTDITVDDDRASGISCPADPLPPGESMTCTADPYTVTQADVDAGQVVNEATAKGTPPGGGDPVTSEPSRTNTPTPEPDPAIAVVKHAQLNDGNDNGTADLGETIDYSFTVTNTGNRTLTEITVSDDRVTGISCPAGPLAPGESVTCTADPYTVTQDDVDAGQVVNVATAQGTPPGGGDPVGSPPSRTNTPTSDPAPAIQISKRAELDDRNDNGRADLGETIRFAFVVTNVGNLTLRDVGVHDPIAGDVSCEQRTLRPGQETACAADEPYPVTQADVDAGAVRNTAVSFGTPPRPAGGTGEPTPVASEPAHTETPTTAPAPALTIVKRATVTPAERAGGAWVGDRISFDFVVTNSGNVTLHDVGVDDPKAGPVRCPERTLAPGASVRCSAERPYVVSEDDVAAGSVRNVASALGTPPGGAGPLRSSPAETSTPTARAPEPPPPPPPPPPAPLPPSLRVEKRADVARVAVGQRVEYRIQVTNDGPGAARAVRLVDTLGQPATVVAVRSSVGRCGGRPTACELGDLAPGGSATITVRVRARRAGTLVNQATATAGSDAGGSVQAQGRATVTVLRPAALRIRKTADRRTVRAGADVRYRIIVTAVGRATAYDVQVCDRLPRGLAYRSVRGARLRNGRACWRIARLRGGRSRSFRVVARATNLERRRTLVNTATATALNARSRSARARVVVVPRPVRPGGVTG
ncbi:DUF7507 domain-containing protein [Patulibacter defluvii]|uniref:DUF7507 domain-containing protein n=2 Tax=Bacteria TaxID=2 RepID=UPI002A747E67|nr:hypothetical protein [Patulibacter sp. DM4]